MGVGGCMEFDFEQSIFVFLFCSGWRGADFSASFLGRLLRGPVAGLSLARLAARVCGGGLAVRYSSGDETSVAALRCRWACRVAARCMWITVMLYSHRSCFSFPEGESCFSFPALARAAWLRDSATTGDETERFGCHRQMTCIREGVVAPLVRAGIGMVSACLGRCPCRRLSC